MKQTVNENNKKFFVRYEIVGEFVEKECFSTKEEATAFYNARVVDCIYDEVKMWEA